MSKHTPGPWFAVRGNAYWEVEPMNAGNGVPFTVADVCPSEPGNPDGGLQEANARLIAAAPELLEALEETWRIIESAGINNLANGVQLGPTAWLIKCCDARDLSNAAIAKAKGESNA